MREAAIFINSEYHTGQLRAASNELLYHDISMVGTFQDRISNTNPSISPLPTEMLIRLMLGPQQLSPDTKKAWKNKEKWVNRLMVAAHLLDYPHHMEMRATEMLESVKGLKSMREAEGYLNLTRLRLAYLLSDPGQQRLDTLRLACVTFVENAILRRAIYDGIYFRQAS